ncbi:cotranscriptional regulator ARB2A-like [Glandiceps talaboti]
MWKRFATTILLALFIHQVIIVIRDSKMADNENTGAEEQQMSQEIPPQAEPMETEQAVPKVVKNGEEKQELPEENKEEENSQMDTGNELSEQVLDEAKENVDEKTEDAAEGGAQQLQQEAPNQSDEPASQKLDQQDDSKTEGKDDENKSDVADVDKKEIPEKEGEKDEKVDKTNEVEGEGAGASKLVGNETDEDVKKDMTPYEMTKLKRELERNRTFTFPSTLEEFGYAFNEDGELRDIKTGDKFEFFVKKDDHLYNQKRYEAIGEIITEIVYKKLDDLQLKRHVIPVDATEEEPKSFIFMSDDALSNTDKVMLLIHGSGVVRAGQWARSLIINQNMESGTQIPYIKRAMNEGYGLIILNGNENYQRKEERKGIRENQTAENHTRYVWDNFVIRSKAKQIVIVAHSYGGLCVTSLCISREKAFYQKVTAVAMTDSIHSLHLQEANDPVINWFIKNAVNWVTSDQEIDTPVTNTMLEVPKLSAGTKKHEETSHKCIDSIFKYFTEKLSKEVPSGTKDKSDVKSTEAAKGEDVK